MERFPRNIVTLNRFLQSSYTCVSDTIYGQMSFITPAIPPFFNQYSEIIRHISMRRQWDGCIHIAHNNQLHYMAFEDRPHHIQSCIVVESCNGCVCGSPYRHDSEVSLSDKEECIRLIVAKILQSNPTSIQI